MLISILIPTRERADYLKAALATCVAIPDPNIEIVVSDNASLDRTQDVIRSFDDPRIVNVNPGRRVSMRQNFDFAIGRSTGEYVYIIGDDDGMLPEQFRALRDIIEEYKPVAFTGRHLSFGWPMPNYHRRGHIKIRREHTFGVPSFVEAAPLARLVAAGRGDGAAPVPRIYHGCASRRMLERMRSATGAFLNSRAPDTYFMLYTLFNEERYLFAEHPFSIAGHSSVDTGGAHRFHPDDPRAEPANRFALEAESDPRQDQFPGRWKVMSLAYFSSLETVRRDFPAANIRPDYSNWYQQILRDARGKGNVFPEVMATLGAYAESIGTTDEFREASRDEDSDPRPIARFIRRIAKNLRLELPIVISGAEGGVNTVATAAKAVDRVLGDGYLRTKKPNTRLTLWSRAQFRAFRGGLTAFSAKRLANK